MTLVKSQKPSLIDLKGAWSVPVFIFVVMVYFFLFPKGDEESLEQAIAFSAFFASVSCLVCVAVTGHRLVSFLTVVALAHLIYYPVAAVLNLMLEQPAVRSDLWPSTTLAMWSCALGCSSLAAGATLWETLGPKDLLGKKFAKSPTVSVGASICLWAFLVPAVLLRFIVGIYDERFAEDVLGLIDKTQHYQNVLAYLTRISLVGMLLQLFRAMNRRSARDFLIFFGMAGTFVAAFLPTGGRAAAYGWVPWFFLFYLALEKKFRRAVGVFAILLVLFSFLTVVAGYYRTTHQLNKPIAERYQSMAEVGSTVYSGSDDRPYLASIVGRLSDYENTGRIIDYTPEVTPFRGAYGLDELWLMFVPKLLFHDRQPLAAMDASMDDYGATQASLGGGSSPCMIIGDLFSRWGWAGVIVGMLVLGIALSAVSHYFLEEWTVQSVCFYALFVQYVASVTQAGVFSTIVVFTRELLIAWLISKALGVILSSKARGSRAGILKEAKPQTFSLQGNRL